jgi:sortase A
MTHRFRKSLRGWRTAVAGLAALLLVVTLVFQAVPKSGPALSAGELYGRYVSAQPVRLAESREPVPPSVTEPVGASAGPTSVPAPVPVAGVYRLEVPSLKIDAPVVALNLTPEGRMEDPPDAQTVAWYDFTALPGSGGNAVFSGHLDYLGYGPAVFWNLRALRPGDIVRTRMDDGTIVEYAVTASHSYPVFEMPMREIVGRTSVESVTLITCDGTFSDGEYSHRLVVRAVRV